MGSTRLLNSFLTAFLLLSTLTSASSQKCKMRGCDADAKYTIMLGARGHGPRALPARPGYWCGQFGQDKCNWLPKPKAEFSKLPCGMYMHMPTFSTPWARQQHEKICPDCFLAASVANAALTLATEAACRPRPKRFPKRTKSLVRSRSRGRR